MIKNSKLKFIEYMQNISRSKSFGKFVLIVSCSEMSFKKTNFRYPTSIGYCLESRITQSPEESIDTFCLIGILAM